LSFTASLYIYTYFARDRLRERHRERRRKTSDALKHLTLFASSNFQGIAPRAKVVHVLVKWRIQCDIVATMDMINPLNNGNPPHLRAN
jgi:hypothetical protein